MPAPKNGPAGERLKRAKLEQGELSYDLDGLREIVEQADE